MCVVVLHLVAIFSHFCFTILFHIFVIISPISGPYNYGHILLFSTVFGLPSDFTDGGNNLYEFILEVIIAVLCKV